MEQKLGKRYLSFFEICKISGQIYLHQFNYILILAVLVYMPMTLAFYLMPESLHVDLTQLNGTTHINQILGQVYYYIGINILFNPVSIGYITYLVQKELEGVNFTLNDLIHASFGKWGYYMITAFLYIGLLIVTGPTIIFPIYFSISFLFFNQFISIGEKWGFKSLMDSRLLVRGQFWHIASFMLALMFLTLLFNYIYEIIVYQFFYLNHFVFILWFNVLFLIFTSFFHMIVSVKFFNLFMVRLVKAEAGKKEQNIF